MSGSVSRGKFKCQREVAGGGSRRLRGSDQGGVYLQDSFREQINIKYEVSEGFY